jgi:hypothetical protein
MAEQDPLKPVEPTVLRPVTGHRRLVQVSHPNFNGCNLLTTDAGWSDTHQPNYVTYAFTPPSGSKQKTVHSQGPSEITWTLSGELTSSTIGLLSLMNSSARGVNFSTIHMLQGPVDSYYFSNNPSVGSFLPWSSFTLNGNQNGAVSYTLEGRSTNIPTNVPSAVSGLTLPDVPVPSWYTGNQYVTAWSISHSVNLAPQWANSPSAYPAYYRPGVSEYTIQVTTMVGLIEHSLIKFGVGGITMVEAVVTSRNRTFGGRGAPMTYQATVNNARVSDQNQAYPSVVVTIPATIPTAAFGIRN